MKLNAVKIASVQVLGATGNVLMTFSEPKQAQNRPSIKPMSILLARLTTVQQEILRVSPDLLVGSVITVSDSDYNGVHTTGEIVAFQKGDMYTADENSSKVRDGVTNPKTDKPYVKGEDIPCESDGIRIQGNLNIALPQSLLASIAKINMEMAISKAQERISQPKTAITVVKSETEETAIVDEFANAHVELTEQAEDLPPVEETAEETAKTTKTAKAK